MQGISRIFFYVKLTNKNDLQESLYTIFMKKKPFCGKDIFLTYECLALLFGKVPPCTPKTAYVQNRETNCPSALGFSLKMSSLASYTKCAAD
jgi:hypothetical protein